MRARDRDEAVSIPDISPLIAVVTRIENRIEGKILLIQG
jgi:hypothetical protein